MFPIFRVLPDWHDAYLSVVDVCLRQNIAPAAPVDRPSVRLHRKIAAFIDARPESALSTVKATVLIVENDPDRKTRYQ